MKRYISIDLVSMRMNGLSLEKWVFLENIYFMSNNEYHACFASKEELRELLGVSNGQIYKIINELINDGFITKNKFGHLKVTQKSLDILSSNSSGDTLQKMEKDSPKNGKRLSKKWSQQPIKKEIEERDEVITPISPCSEIVETDHIPYSEIIDHLNMILSSGFRHSSKKTQAMIKARWNEGFRLGDFQYVHMVKAMEWGNDEKMSKFLRPETLYSDKFEGYRNQKLPRRAYGEQMQAQLESQGFQNVFDYLESMPQSNQQVISA